MATHTTEIHMTETHMTEAGGTTATAVRVTRKGWHDDPRGEHKLRYHDGDTWTEHTTHFGPVPCHGCR
jgi:hypothetical protein